MKKIIVKAGFWVLLMMAAMTFAALVVPDRQPEAPSMGELIAETDRSIAQIERHMVILELEYKTLMKKYQALQEECHYFLEAKQKLRERKE